MVYSLEELMMFAIIYSDIENGRFPKPKVNHKSLYHLFNNSLKNEVNIFKIDKIKLENFIEQTIKDLVGNKDLEKVDKKVEELKNYFLYDSGKNKIEQLKNKALEEFKLAEEQQINCIDYFSEDYPKYLKEIEQPPFIIFYKGYFPKNIELEKSLAVIGTRNPDKKYGEKVATKTGKMLKEIGWWNISGLAIGCDEYGHKGSLEAGGMTGAILGQGLGTTVFPKENIQLAEDILKNKGFLMSELPPSISPSSIFFVLRDRLQSGMTRGIFVVETSNKSGTLHTVKYSLSQERLTYVWDPSDIEDLRDSEEVIGNMKLLRKTDNKDKFNVPISEKSKDKIIGIKNSFELKQKLAELEQITRMEKSKIEPSNLKQQILGGM